jgi:hypothetical protein
MPLFSWEILMSNAERAAVLDLLAIIYRDGGQYVAEHGVEKAARDAIERWFNRIEASSLELMARSERADSAEKALYECCKLALRTLDRVTFGGFHDCEHERETFRNTIRDIHVRNRTR